MEKVAVMGFNNLWSLWRLLAIIQRRVDSTWSRIYISIILQSGWLVSRRWRASTIYRLLQSNITGRSIKCCHQLYTITHPSLYDVRNYVDDEFWKEALVFFFLQNVFRAIIIFTIRVKRDLHFIHVSMVDLDSTVRYV